MTDLIAGAPLSQTPPELILGKFKNHEELATAYKQLEEKLGKAPAAGAVQTPDAAASTQTPAATAAQESWIAPFSSEYQTNGKLSDASYAALESKGVPRNMVDGYIAGQLAVQAQNQQAIDKVVFDAVGGEAAYMQMAQWAAANLPAAEVQQINERIEASKTAADARFVAEALQARYLKANGMPAQTSLAGVAGGMGVQPFADYDELSRATSDPRYTTSEAFRAEVSKRIAASPNL